MGFRVFLFGFIYLLLFYSYFFAQPYFPEYWKELPKPPGTPIRFAPDPAVVILDGGIHSACLEEHSCWVSVSPDEDHRLYGIFPYHTCGLLENIAVMVVNRAAHVVDCASVTVPVDGSLQYSYVIFDDGSVWKRAYASSVYDTMPVAFCMSPLISLFLGSVTVVALKKVRTRKE